MRLPDPRALQDLFEETDEIRLGREATEVRVEPTGERAGRADGGGPMSWWRYLWAGPTTGIGLFVALLALATGGRTRRVRGVLECWGGAPRFFLLRRPFRASALTLGHVIVGESAYALDRCRTHELAHVRQAERWGPLFIPAYLAAGLWALLRGRHPYRDNPFEVEAREQGGE